MKRRILGRTNLSVSALSLGTVELGLDYGIPTPGEFGRPSERVSIALVHAVLDAGINFIDTARAYGSSEEVLGRALDGRREQVVIVTKVDPSCAGPGAGFAELRRSMRDDLTLSLEALQSDYVDVWMIHNVDHALLERRDEIAEIFGEVQAEGRVHWRGGSFYGAALPQAALAYDLFDVMQITYSLLDQRLADEVLPLAAEQNVGVAARSVLLKGALTERAEDLPEHLAPLRARSRALGELLAQAQIGLTRAQAAVAFALAQPHIDSVLIGVRTVAELTQNLAAIEIEVPPELYDAMADLKLDDERLLDPSTWGIP